MENENTKPDTEKRGRGRPKGSGRGLSATQRALNSRMRRSLDGGKRLEVVLSQDAYVALKILQGEMGVETYRDVIETLLINSVNPDAAKGAQLTRNRLRK